MLDEETSILNSIYTSIRLLSSAQTSTNKLVFFFLFLACMIATVFSPKLYGFRSLPTRFTLAIEFSTSTMRTTRSPFTCPTAIPLEGISLPVQMGPTVLYVSEWTSNWWRKENCPSLTKQTFPSVLPVWLVRPRSSVPRSFLWSGWILVPSKLFLLREQAIHCK